MAVPLSLEALSISKMLFPALIFDLSTIRLKDPPRALFLAGGWKHQVEEMLSYKKEFHDEQLAPGGLSSSSWRMLPCAHPWIIHRFLAMSTNTAQGFFSTSWTQDESKASLRSGSARLWGYLFCVLWLIFQLFRGFFFPSVVILVKLEVFVIATIDHSWSHLPSPAGLSLSCAHSVALSCLVFLKNVSLLTSGYRRTQNLASSPRTWLWIPN